MAQSTVLGVSERGLLFCVMSHNLGIQWPSDYARLVWQEIQTLELPTFAFCCDLASSGAFFPLANWENAGIFGSVLGVSGLKRKRRESEGVKAAFSTSARTKVAYVWLLF